MNKPAAEFDCVGCGRHIIIVAGPVTQRERCATCVYMPGWVDDDKLRPLLDPDCPRGGWGTPPAGAAPLARVGFQSRE